MATCSWSARSPAFRPTSGWSRSGIASPWVQIAAVVLVAAGLMALLGALIGKYLVLPLRGAPALNTLLITLMLGTALRESIRVFYPDGANPKPFPALLPSGCRDLRPLHPAPRQRDPARSPASR